MNLHHRGGGKRSTVSTAVGGYTGMILEKKMLVLALCSTLVFVALLPGAIEARGDRVSSTSGSGGMTQDEVAVLAGIDVDNAWSELEYLASLGEKLGGTAEELSAQQYVFSRFMDMSLDEVVIEPFSTSSWVHHGTTLNIILPEMEGIPTTAYGGCYSIWGTQDGEPYYFGNSNDGKSLIAQVVDVGRGTSMITEGLHTGLGIYLPLTPSHSFEEPMLNGSLEEYQSYVFPQLGWMDFIEAYWSASGGSKAGHA